MCFLAVNFHYISDESFAHPGIYPVTPQAFERQLDALGQYFDFVGLTDLVNAVAGEQTLPAHSCLITFDDGLQQQVDNALPILERKGIPAAFFVNTENFVEKRVSTVHKIHYLRATRTPNRFYDEMLQICATQNITFAADAMISAERLQQQYRYDTLESARLKYTLNFIMNPSDRDQMINAYFATVFGDDAAFAETFYFSHNALMTLAAQDYLGSHGHTHVPLAQLEYATLMENITSSLEHLQNLTGHTPQAISYPFGSASAVSHEVADVAAAAGLELGFTMERAFNRSLKQPLLMARCDTNDALGGKSPKMRVQDGQVIAESPFRATRAIYI